MSREPFQPQANMTMTMISGMIVQMTSSGVLCVTLDTAGWSHVLRLYFATE